jgi:hypothetical protein
VPAMVLLARHRERILPDRHDRRDRHRCAAARFERVAPARYAPRRTPCSVPARSHARPSRIAGPWPAPRASACRRSCSRLVDFLVLEQPVNDFEPRNEPKCLPRRRTPRHPTPASPPASLDRARRPRARRHSRAGRRASRVVLAFQMRAGQRLGAVALLFPRILPMPSMVVSSPAASHCSANHCRAAMSSGEKVGRWTPVL